MISFQYRSRYAAPDALLALALAFALRELSDKQVVALDDQSKAAMVSNLMTVLCAGSEVQPVITTGTLYN